MDSPAFGSNQRNPPLTKPHQIPPQNPQTQKAITNLITALTLEKHIRKLVKSVNQIRTRALRDTFHRLRSMRDGGFDCGNLQANQLALLMDVQRKVGGVFAVCGGVFVRNKIRAWRQIVLHNTCANKQTIVSEAKRSNTVHNDQRADLTKLNSQKSKRAGDWKQNSAYNMGDLSGENKRLKSQIQKQQMQEESFIAKMKSLLDVHQKQRPKLQQNKKKK